MGNTDGTITRRMETVLNGLESDFKGLYCDRDIETQLEYLKKAKSDRASVLKTLYKMLDSFGIPYRKGESNEYYESLAEQTDIPTSQDNEFKMLYSLYIRFEHYPTPEKYMERMVNRLCDKSDRWENDTLRLRILKQFIKYGNYLNDAGFGGRNAVKGYVKEKTGKKSVSDDDVLSGLDDGVFEYLKNSAKEDKKPTGKYGLLKTADDLAFGKFRTGGASKKSLYMFAMVYNMSYYSGDTDNGEILNYDTDIEKNLFSDYYVNNLMRYITDAYSGHTEEFELDPSGQGINYKNFAEMIYLYYISKELLPQEKIKRSADMITDIQKRQKSEPEKSAELCENDTVYYRGLFKVNARNVFSEDILRLPENEFETFIFENFDCDTQSRIGSLQLETEQNTALDVYNGILDDIRQLDVKTDELNYGLWFTDVEQFKRQGYDSILSEHPEIDRDKFAAFTELLIAANKFISKALEKSIDSSNVTRTAIVTAYYYYYNALHYNDANDNQRSFEEVFSDLKRGVDERLQQAYYQPFCGKNIFDVLIAFSSYSYIYA